MAYNNATISIPRDPAECLREFEQWLEAASQRERAGSATSQTAAKDIAWHYRRAKLGLTRVDCFCGQPAESIREIARDIAIEDSGSGLRVGLCHAHTRELVDAARLVRSIEEQAQQAARNMLSNTFSVGSGSID